MKAKYLLYAAIVAAVILAGAIWKSCSEPPVIDTHVHVVDSLRTVNDSLKKAHSAYMDSMGAILNRAYHTIDDFEVAKVEAERRADKASGEAKYFAKLYDLAKSQKDTLGELSACDSIRNMLDSIQVTSSMALDASDSVINSLWSLNLAQDHIIKHQEQQLAQKDTIITNLTVQFQQVDAAYMKLLRKKRSFWENLKDWVIKFGIGFAAGKVMK